MDGEVWSGRFDFTLLRPVDGQFFASFRYWQPLALLDLAMGLGVLVWQSTGWGRAFPWRTCLPRLAMAAALVILYAIPADLHCLDILEPRASCSHGYSTPSFRWRGYPVGLYPGWLRLALTWIVPVGADEPPSRPRP